MIGYPYLEYRYRVYRWLSTAVLHPYGMTAMPMTPGVVNATTTTMVHAAWQRSKVAQASEFQPRSFPASRSR